MNIFEQNCICIREFLDSMLTVNVKKKKKKPVSIEVVVQFDRLDDRDSSSAFAISEERSNLQ